MHQPNRTSPLILLCILLTLGCQSPQGAKPPAHPDPASAPQVPTPPAAQQKNPPNENPPSAGITKHPAPARLVAVGDIHGDLEAARRTLRAAALIDDQDHWIGGQTMLVQTGDILDRGDDEVEIIALLEKLQPEATAAGGKIIVMSGNHEVMNVQGDMRYVTPGGFADFVIPPDPKTAPPELAQVPEHARPRVAAFLPGAPYAQKMANYPVVVVVGDTLFAHGGVLPEHVRYGLDRINTETAAWMRGTAPPPAILSSDQSPIWSRHFSASDPADTPCDLLAQTLQLAGVKRMVVGHTPQQSGITSACDGRVWRIDTGMASHYGGPSQALDIQGDSLKVLGQ